MTKAQVEKNIGKSISFTIGEGKTPQTAVLAGVTTSGDYVELGLGILINREQVNLVKAEEPKPEPKPEPKVSE